MSDFPKLDEQPDVFEGYEKIDEMTIPETFSEPAQIPTDIVPQEAVVIERVVEKEREPEIIEKPEVSKTNVWGIIGFILSILTWIFSFLGIGLIFWPFAFTFCIIGACKKKKTLSIIGLILSLIYLIAIIAIIILIAVIGVPVITSALGGLATFLFSTKFLTFLAMIISWWLID